uniref:Uncharacterized protein n=1 Tax=Romanomermis culicivorax TaxID=13658 RepID=A0A915KAI9_ROMCU
MAKFEEFWQLASLNLLSLNLDLSELNLFEKRRRLLLLIIDYYLLLAANCEGRFLLQISSTQLARRKLPGGRSCHLWAHQSSTRHLNYETLLLLLLILANVKLLIRVLMNRHTLTRRFETVPNQTSLLSNFLLRLVQRPLPDVHLTAELDLRLYIIGQSAIGATELIKTRGAIDTPDAATAHRTIDAFTHRLLHLLLKSAWI